MSLYQLQKLLFDLNRQPAAQIEYRQDLSRLLGHYALTDQERQAMESGDIGLIYVLGANGQLLMHYAAFLGLAWPDYIRAMREGVSKYGPVQSGIYAMTTNADDRVAGV